ncbi:MAG: hypothetical protein P1V35_15205 [Planctomycetota bacterium]|nr:hypothetical protein [Planctomycetota bacterium]
MPEPTHQELAQTFLQEAVYNSRGAQAGKATMSPGGKGQCGLGKEAAVVLDLSPQAEEVLHKLWPDGLDDAGITRLQEQMTAWVEAQDQLDRKRNHFMKAFRGKHGFRRADYDPQTLAAYEAGLDEVNQESLEALRQAAEHLLKPQD